MANWTLRRQATLPVTTTEGPGKTSSGFFITANATKKPQQMSRLFASVWELMSLLHEQHFPYFREFTGLNLVEINAAGYTTCIEN